MFSLDVGNNKNESVWSAQSTAHPWTPLGSWALVCSLRPAAGAWPQPPLSSSDDSQPSLVCALPVRLSLNQEPAPAAVSTQPRPSIYFPVF